LRQHPEPLAGHRRVEIGEAGDVSAGMGQALDEPLPDRVGDDHEDDRDRWRLPPQRRDRGGARRQEHVGVERDQFCRIALVKRGVAAGQSPVDAQIVAFVPVTLGERLHQDRVAGLP
jgi:hypothetical protein